MIAGDIGAAVLKQLGVMFTDWMFFDRADNDLVVDTDSMYSGLASRNETRYLLDQGRGDSTTSAILPAAAPARR